MGGLLGAYDITGQQKKYHGLVDKAVELAEVLMATFDTPNRMPVLFYQWRPEQAKLSKHAATNIAMSEIGSLSLEFTRLAQITGEQKYYDAVARVMDYFRVWQDNTLIPGLFDNQVDASGCASSWTQAQLKKEQQEEEEEETRKDFSSFGDDSEDNVVVHVNAEEEDDTQGPDPRKDHSSFGDVDSEIDLPNDYDGKDDLVVHVKKRQLDVNDEKMPDQRKDQSSFGDADSDTPTKASQQEQSPDLAKPATKSVSPSPICVKYDGFQSWQHYHPGTVRSSAEYGLGGGADSTYEYLPKVHPA